MKKVIVLISVFTALVFACQKNTDEPDQSANGPIPRQQVNASLIGKVLDENSRAVANATVTVAGTTYQTNTEGLFIVRKKLLDNNGTLIRVEKAGFFEASRFAFPHQNSTTYIEISLIPKALSATFDAASGGSIAIGQDAKVLIPANATARADGSPYQGSVRAYAVWLDPGKAETFEKMPGDLRGINTEGVARMLKTYGMIGVELESSIGEKLNLLAGKTAKITLNVPAAMRSKAPANIPLWHFNSDKGYWEEEGSANLVNGSYEGEVRHFSFWNLDVPGDYVKLSMQLVTANQEPIQSMYILIESDNFGLAAGYTDENGRISGLVPKDEHFLMNLNDLCLNVVKQTPIGPFSTDTDLGAIAINDIDLTTVTGILHNCDNAPVINGLITLKQAQSVQGQYVLSNTNGVFSIRVLRCASLPSAVLTGYDLDKKVQSPAQGVTLGAGTTNAGILKACQPLDEFATITCDGITQTYFTDPSNYFDPSGSGVVSFLGPPNPASQGFDSVAIYFYFNKLNIAQNQATLGSVSFVVRQNNIRSDYGCFYCEEPTCGCTPVDAGPVVFTQYPNAVGEYLEGYTSGKMQKRNQTGTSAGPLLPFTLNFRIKRRE